MIYTFCIINRKEYQYEWRGVEIIHEEWEALRLKNVEDLSQTESAAMINISQSTFQRILCSAYKKRV